MVIYRSLSFFSIFPYFVNHQYSVPTIYQRVSCTWIFKKSFDFLFFNFRQHAEGAQRPCHRKRPKMSQRPYLRAFCKARKFHF